MCIFSPRFWTDVQAAFPSCVFPGAGGGGTWDHLAGGLGVHLAARWGSISLTLV